VHKMTTINEHQSENKQRSTIRRIFARKTTVRRITAAVTMVFLEKHHLWGATKAKHNYGLFVGDKNKKGSNNANEEELVAVATFSARRKIIRMGKPHRSHELLRFCSRRDSNVVGGISKLIKAFVKEKAPDDIVTVVDRDWGDGSGWHSIGFHTVATMDPIVMTLQTSVEADESRHSQRYHLVGAGIKSATILNKNGNATGTANSTYLEKKDRIGLSTDILQELDSLDSIEDVLDTLSNHGHFPVYDTGVERLMKVMSCDGSEKDSETMKTTISEMWQNSKPTYAKEYYSPNLGITTLLNHASKTPSALTQLIASRSVNQCQ